jgi:hypothetical protein
MTKLMHGAGNTRISFVWLVQSICRTNGGWKHGGEKKEQCNGDLTLRISHYQCEYNALQLDLR